MSDIYDEKGNLMVGRNFDNIKRTYDFIRIGNVAISMLDTRFQRTFEFDQHSKFLGNEQFDLLKKNLQIWKSDESVEHILICTGSPLAFFTPKFAEITYAIEEPKEIYPTHPILINELFKLMEMISGNSKVKLLAGDLHQFVNSKICNQDFCIDQMISSGMSKRSALVKDFDFVVLYGFFRYFMPQNFGNWKMKHLEQVIMNNYGVINVNGNILNWHGVFRDIDQLNLKERMNLFIFDNFLVLISSIIGILIFLFIKLFCK